MNMFKTNAGRRVNRNKFDLSQERKQSFEFGELVPMMCEEIIPGDSFKVNSEILVRLAPMLAPLMHRVNVYTHFFFVPNRLIWEDWEDFVTGGRDGSLLPEMPRIVTDMNGQDEFKKGSVANHLGMPALTFSFGAEGGTPVSALPFRAYQLIFQEYYQDQNLNAELDISTQSGLISDPTEIRKHTDMRYRAWEKDYFTSCLPWAQRGAEVSMPVEFNYKSVSDVFDANGNIPQGDAPLKLVSGSTGSSLLAGATPTTSRIENLEEQATQFTINDFRKAVTLQQWLERTARGGSRYIEQILSHFGVRSSDARLQRPEYLGGGKSPLVVSEVLNQTGSTATGANPQGDMTGHGISVGNSHASKRRFEEHGWLIGLISVIPRTAYQQGMPRQFLKTDKFDFFWPEFANLGEQQVNNEEIWYNHIDDVTTPTNKGLFGYQSRYAEYKWRHDHVSGDFVDTNNFWHMGRIFGSMPALNNSFVTYDPANSKRIFAVQTEGVDNIYAQIYNRVSAVRPVPYYSTPGISRI